MSDSYDWAKTDKERLSKAIDSQMQDIRVVAHDILETSIGALLHDLGADQEVIQNTPRRWVRALGEMLRGYGERPEHILKVFDGVGYKEMIVCGPIKFYSLCEHHLLPFVGHAHVGYLPGKRGRIVGLSKLPRLVECYARRLQVQERLTKQIADALMAAPLKASGAGVFIDSQHFCMCARGVSQQEATMKTQFLAGNFIHPAVRAEFMKLCTMENR